MWRFVARNLFSESVLNPCRHLIALRASTLSHEAPSAAGAVSVAENVVEESKDEPVAGITYTAPLKRKNNIMRMFRKTLSEIHDSGRPQLRQLDALYDLVKQCSTGNIAESPAAKVELAEEMWRVLKERGIPLNIGFYNILLKVYNSNEHQIQPSKYLQMVTAAGVKPNLGLFVQLTEAYCNQGNIAGATTLLDHMKNVELPITEQIYASLITGHSRCGNMEEAERIIRIMQERKHNPGNVSYTALLCGFAERGRMEDIERILAEMRERRLFPSLVVYIKVIDSLSKSGHNQHIHRVLELCKNKPWLVVDIRSLAATLVLRGERESAMMLVQALSEMNANTNYLSQLIVQRMAAEKSDVGDILDVIDELSGVNYVETFDPFHLYLSLFSPLYLGELTSGGQLASDLLLVAEHMAKQGVPLRQHFLYPALIHYSNKGRVKEFIGVLNKLHDWGVFTFSKEIAKFLWKALSQADKNRLSLEGCDPNPEIGKSILVRLISRAWWPLAGKWVQSMGAERLNLDLLKYLLREKLLTYDKIAVVMPLFLALHEVLAPEVFSHYTQLIVLALNVNRKYPQAIELVQHLEAKGIVDCDIYCTLLLGLARSHPVFQRILHTVKEMPESQNSLQFKKLLTKLQTPGKPQQLDGLLEDRAAFDRELGEFRNKREKGETPDPSQTQNLILSAFERNKPALAEEIFNEAESVGVVLHRRSWDRLIMHYAKTGELEKCQVAFGRMKSYGIEPSENTYKWLMHIHEQTGDVAEVRRLIDEAKEAGLPVTRYFVSSLMKALVKSNKVAEAVGVVDEFSPVLPLTSTVVELINVVLYQGLPRSSLDRLVQCLRDNQLTDIHINNILLFNFVQAGLVHDAEAILQQEGFEIDRRRLYQYFNFWIGSGKIDVAKFLFKLYVASGLTNSSANNRSCFRIARAMLRRETVPFSVEQDVDYSEMEEQTVREVDMEELLKELMKEDKLTTPT